MFFRFPYVPSITSWLLIEALDRQVYEALSCSELADIDIPLIQRTTLTVLGELEALLTAKNIYPFYDHLVRQGICTHVIGTLALSLGLQVQLFHRQEFSRAPKGSII